MSLGPMMSFLLRQVVKISQKRFDFLRGNWVSVNLKQVATIGDAHTKVPFDRFDVGVKLPAQLREPFAVGRRQSKNVGDSGCTRVIGQFSWRQTPGFDDEIERFPAASLAWLP